MTPIVLTDAFVLINAQNLSAWMTKVELKIEYEDLDATTMGQNAHVRRAGLQDGTVGITFLVDETAAALDSIMWALQGQVVPYEIRPTSAVRGTSNPAYLGNILVNAWTPISGDVGKLNTCDVSYGTSGLNTRATA